MSVLATIPTPPPTTTPSATPSRHDHLLQLLNHCSSISHLKQLHAQTLRTTSPHHPNTLFLYTRILHSASARDLAYTFRLFNHIQNPNSFAWNTLIRACAQSSDRKYEALLLFNKMLAHDSSLPDKHTFPFVLKACAYVFQIREGKQVHSQILKRGLGSDLYVNNSLIHFYSSCGCLKDARKVFDEMPERSVVSWNIMVDALVVSGEFYDGLRLFTEMQKLFEPDGYTMQSVIGACAGLGALSLGTWAHAYVMRRLQNDSENFNVLLDNCLIDMYYKCGSSRMAAQVFDRMSKRDLNSWNSMILGLAAHGDVEAALDCFSHMVKEGGLTPNSITFSGVLSACSHRGSVSDGREYFDMMTNDFKINPVLEHYGCLVDLLARAGRIDEALDVVSNMPMKPDAVIWRSLLDASCKKNAEIEMSESLAEQIIESDSNVGSGVFVLLSRVYAAANRWDDVGLIRKLMTDKGVMKEPGCSSIEIDGTAHEFFAGRSAVGTVSELDSLA